MEGVPNQNLCKKTRKISSGTTEYEKDLEKYAMKMLNACVLHKEKSIDKKSLENYWKRSDFPEDLAIDTVQFLEYQITDWTNLFLNQRMLSQESQVNIWSDEESEQIVNSVVKATFDYYDALCSCCREEF